MKTEASEPSTMHHAVSSSVPAFLAKLWAMVNEESTDAVIGWTECNKSFYIRNQSVFSMELLPVYYKHNNMASFVRQLNMYGFRKVLSPMAGSLRNESDEMIFAHPDFVRDEPWGLENIKRKIPHHKDLPHASGELIARLYSEVKSMKSKQDSLDSHLNKMKRENESLWREVLVLRQKHAKQQQIVNKVIQFLVPFLQSGRAPTSTFMGLKRKQLPMLEDGGGAGEPSAKAPRLQRTYSMDENMAASIDNRSIASTAGSPGPVIHEVTDAVTSPAAAAPGTSSSSTQHQPQQPHMTQDEFLASSTGRPESTVDWTPLVENLPAGPSGDFSPADVPAPAATAEDTEENQQQQHQQQQPQDTTVALTVSPDPNQEPTPVLCDSLLESIQADLEGLRGLMGSPNWRIDTSSVQNILSNPDQALTASASGGESDQQLITYNPSLLDLFTSESDDLFPDLRGLEEDEDEAVPQPALAGPAAASSGAGDAGAQSSGLNTPTVEMRGGPVFPANPASGGGRKSAFASATPASAGEAGKEMAPMGGRRSELNTPTIEVPRTAFPVVTGKASKQGKRRK